MGLAYILSVFNEYYLWLQSSIYQLNMENVQGYKGIRELAYRK